MRKKFSFERITSKDCSTVKMVDSSRRRNSVFTDRLCFPLDKNITENNSAELVTLMMMFSNHNFRFDLPVCRHLVSSNAMIVYYAIFLNCEAYNGNK